MFDSEILGANVFSLFADLFIHGRLFLIQIFNHLTQCVIHSIEAFKFLIHIIGLVLHILNFFFSRANFTLQFLDFVVQNKFELFKFLGTFFQFINFLFFVTDLSVRFFNLLILGFNFLKIMKL